MRALYLLTLVGMFCSAMAGGIVRADQPQEARITIPQGSRLEAVLQRLDGARGGVLVADGGGASRSMKAALDDATFSQALEHVARDFDRFWIRQGNIAVLQSRLADGNDEVFLELDELRRAVDDLAELMRPVAPRIPGPEFTALKQQFLASLTPEQLIRAQGAGLPFGELPAVQRQALLRINARHCWDEAELEVSRAQLCFDNWEKLSIRPLSRMRPPTQFLIPLADVGGDGVGIDYVPPGTRREAAPKAEGISLPETLAKSPADLSPAWQIPVQRTTLGQLVQTLAREGGPTVQVPRYAWSRSLWVYSTNARRWDVLNAVGLLWGWELSRKGGEYRLDRPSSSPTANALDLCAKFRRTVPPVIRHQVRTQILDAATERWGRDVEFVLREIEGREGPEWQSIRLSSLTPVAQRRLANVIAWRQVQPWFSLHGTSDRVQPWAAFPERGVFQLSGELGPEKHPLARIAVPNENGKPVWWGWVVNTARRDPAPAM